MYYCNFCNRETTSVKSNWIHQSRCKSNPDRYVQVPWNAGKTGLQSAWNKGVTVGVGTPHTDDTKKRLSEIAKNRNLGGYVRGSGRGKKGWYKGFFCDSSWELAYVIYCLEHNIDIKRNTEKRQYVWQGLVKNYIPDFIVSGNLVEIKGYKTKQWLAKISANPDVNILYEKDLKPVLEYVKSKYGKNFINLYE
jgi:hypothetical protein